MSLLNIVFWLLVALIAVLAYCIESGIAARHRAVVLSSILSATLAAGYMLFLLDDNSDFGFTPPPQQAGEGGGGPPPVALSGGGDGSGAGAGGGSGSGMADSALIKKPDGFRDCPVCPLMIAVRGGRYVMGAPQSEKGRTEHEGPQKRMRIPGPFAVSRYEIKRKEFAAFVSAAGYRPASVCRVKGDQSTGHNWQQPGFNQTDEHPVVCINWHDASAYIDWLSERTNRKFRLLSEGEWEFVARARRSTAYWTGHTITPDAAHFASDAGTGPVGTGDANTFGLFDVAGNVWELVDDCWSEDLSAVPSSGAPVRALGDCQRRAIRGGGWNSKVSNLRSAARESIGVAMASNQVGLRVARELQ